MSPNKKDTQYSVLLLIWMRTKLELNWALQLNRILTNWHCYWTKLNQHWTDLSWIFTFTFMHLVDAFIQSVLQCIQVTVFTFYQLLVSLGIEPMILALLAPSSTNIDTILFLELLYSRIWICLIFEEVCINNSVISLFITLKLIWNNMHFKALQK